MASTFLPMSIKLRCNTSHREGLSLGLGRSTLTNYFGTFQCPSRATTLSCSARRQNRDATSNTSKKKLNSNKKMEEDNDMDEDAFEALFRQLEEDLKNDELNGNDDEDVEISEEELAKLERELAEALEEDDELIAAFQSLIGSEMEVESGNEDQEEDEDEDEEEDDSIEEDEEKEMPMKLKNWQLRRLGYALKNGRRKTRIKDLAAELCLDRSVILKLLRDPPPSLVLMSAALPDEPVSTILEPVQVPPMLETLPHDAPKPGEVEKNVPVHVMQSNWSARKRLKKVQVETLEQVYKKSKRPSNAMVSSIVHVTNLPRKKVVKWFEDRRNEDGVPENRVPYQKPALADSVFTS